jgi:hypothetical protein
VIAVRIDPLDAGASLECARSATPSDCFGLITPARDSTNTVNSVSFSPARPRPTRVDRGVEYVMTHYENLLRRLAD